MAKTKAKMKKYKRPKAKKSDWEPLDNEPSVCRLKVPGGWLYRCGNSDNMTFVPDFRVRDRQGEIYTLLSMVLQQSGAR